VSAVGFVVYMSAMTGARFFGDALVGKLGPHGLLGLGGGLVAFGLGSALALPITWVALLGLGLVGMGLANAVPVVFRAAGRHGDPAGAIATVSTVGYVGFLAGPPVIGTLAQGVGLTEALALVAALGVAIALSARIVRGDQPLAEGRPALSGQGRKGKPLRWTLSAGSDGQPHPVNPPLSYKQMLARHTETQMMATDRFPYALAAIDIDDTLVGPDKTIGRENRRAVKKLQNLGCRVILASGRRHDNMLPFCEALGIDDYVVSCQGARVEHRRTGQILRQAALAASDTRSLVREGLDRGFTVLLWLKDGVFAQSETNWVDAYRHETGNDHVSIADLPAIADQPAEKVVWGAEPGQIESAYPELVERFAGRLTVTVTSDWWIEVTAREAHKADAVAAVAASVGIARESVLAFGDGHNDVSLLSWAGLGVAMPHGRPSARAAARVVAAHGDPRSALARAVDLVAERFAGAQAP
jgi:Cof subfamily protein (haloacid dehalogenase superfamily)